MKHSKPNVINFCKLIRKEGESTSSSNEWEKTRRFVSHSVQFNIEKKNDNVCNGKPVLPWTCSVGVKDSSRNSPNAESIVLYFNLNSVLTFSILYNTSNVWFRLSLFSSSGVRFAFFFFLCVCVLFFFLWEQFDWDFRIKSSGRHRITSGQPRMQGMDPELLENLTKVQSSGPDFDFIWIPKKQDRSWSRNFEELD